MKLNRVGRNKLGETESLVKTASGLVDGHLTEYKINCVLNRYNCHNGYLREDLKLFFFVFANNVQKDL